MHRPSTLTELSELIVSAAEHARPLRLVGRGTWLDGGAPVAPGAEPVHLDAFDDIVEYEPGDLTITVGAATSITELDAVTAAHNQWCPLSPWGGDAGSVGATIATATAGPYTHAMGAPRDLVLGLECVDGNGKVLRPGGKVVKNVAGFDLTRLMTGAWGSLAAITQVSLRLRARPAVDETWSVAIGDDFQGDLLATIDALCRGTATPIACEVVNEVMAEFLGLAPTLHVLVRLAGNKGVVAAARDALTPLGKAQPANDTLWTKLREADRDATHVHRLSTDAHGCLAMTIFPRDAWPLRVHASWARRSVRLVVSPGVSFSLAPFADSTDRHTVEKGAYPREPQRADIAALGARVKGTFDPANILNPGIMG